MMSKPLWKPLRGRSEQQEPVPVAGCDNMRGQIGQINSLKLSNSIASSQRSMHRHGNHFHQTTSFLGTIGTREIQYRERRMDSFPSRQICTGGSNVELSQLTTGSGGSLFLDHDVSSSRSNQSSSAALMKMQDPPLHQSSASSNTSNGSIQASAGSNRICCSSMQIRQGKSLKTSLSQPVRSGTGANYSRMEPTESLLRMPIQSRSGSVRSGRSSMMTFSSTIQHKMYPRFPTHSLPSDRESDCRGSQPGTAGSTVSKKHKTTVQNPRSCSVQVEVKSNMPDEFNRLREQIEESLQARITKIYSECESRVADKIKDGASQEERITERMKQLNEKANVVDAKLARVEQLVDASADKENRLSQALKQIEAKGIETKAELLRSVEDHKEKLDAAASSNIERMNNEAGRLLSIHQAAADNMILKVGQLTEDVAAKVIGRGKELAIAVAPYLQLPLNSMLLSLVPSLVNENKNKTPTKQHEDTFLGLPSHKEPFLKGLLDGDNSISYSNLIAIRRSVEAQEPQSVAVSVEKPPRNIQEATTAPFGKAPAKRQVARYLPKENRTPRTLTKNSCVTPNQEIHSPVATFALENAKKLPKKPRSNNSTKHIPLEVIVHSSDADSKTSLLDEKSFDSTRRADFSWKSEKASSSYPTSKKRIKNSKPRSGSDASRKRCSSSSKTTLGRVKRLRTYADKRNSARKSDEDPFEFL